MMAIYLVIVTTALVLSALVIEMDWKVNGR